MKTHDYFETLIFKEEDLTVDERTELDHHLKDCEECSQLRQQWENCLNLFHEAPMISPKAGFNERWAENFQYRTLEQERRSQTRLVVGVTILITLVSAFAAIVLLSPTLLVDLTLQISKALSFLTGFINQMQTILNVVRIPLLAIGVSGIVIAIACILGSLVLARRRKESSEGVE